MATSDESIELLRIKVEGYLNIVRIHRELDARADDLLAEAGVRGITLAQATALLVLVQERQPITAARLAALLNVSPVTVGRFVRSLEDNKWLRRKPDPLDGRAMLLEVTKKTHRNLTRFFEVTDRLMEDAYAGFTPTDVRDAVALLARCRQNLYRISGKHEAEGQVQLL